jgi:hypothetical protein
VTAWEQVASSREPRPELLGLDLEIFPYPSAFSLLLRASRITALEPKEWFRSVGLRFGTLGVDLAEFKAGRVSRQRFEAAMGVAGTLIPTWWSHEAWSPLDTSGALDRLTRPIRMCAGCAAYGYHSMLFQLPSIARCPWHDRDLVDHCPNCGRSTFTQVDEQGRLGRCSCGHDCVEMDLATVRMRSFPTAQAEGLLSEYLEWAGTERSRRRLVVSEDTDRWLGGFAILAEAPRGLLMTNGSPQTLGYDVVSTSDEASSDPPHSEFWGWGALADQRPLTFVPLPKATHDALMLATRVVIAGLPAGTRTPTEVALAHGLDEHVSLIENAVRRPECFIAPLSRGSGSSGWLNVSAVDRTTVEVCWKLLDTVVGICAPGCSVPDLARQAQRVVALSRIQGRRHLASALEKLLLQGYTQGLDGLLRAALGLPPTQRWCLPVAEFAGEPGYLRNIRVCWVQVPAPRLRRASESALDVAPPADAKGRSKQARKQRRKLGKRVAV